LTSTQDPTRLAADPGTSSWLRTALSGAGDESPSAAAVDKLTLRVEAAIAAGLPGPEIGASTNTPAGVLATGKMVIVGVGVALGVVAGTAWKIGHAPHKMSEPAAVAVSAAPAMLPSSAAEAPTPNITVAPTDDTPIVPDEAAKRPASAPTANDRDARNSGLSEAALLDAARAAVKGDPQRALSLTLEFGRRFPKSLLTQEREVIAIEALVRLNNGTAARARADRFARSFPGSAHQQKIDQLTRGM
jgi:hypothetical protein